MKKNQPHLQTNHLKLYLHCNVWASMSLVKDLKPLSITLIQLHAVAVNNKLSFVDACNQYTASIQSVGIGDGGTDENGAE